MNVRKHSVVATTLLGLALCCGAAVAAPQDHLKCYRIADTNESDATVDLATAPFGLDPSCTVEAKARELCVPASAQVLSGGASDTGAVPATEIAQERLCYRIECPRRALPGVVATDRFGSRPIAVRRARTFCTPVTFDTPPP